MRLELVAAAMLAAALGGCGDGDQEAFGAEGRRTPAQRVALLMDVIGQGASQVDALELVTPCQLRVQWQGGAVQAYDVNRLHTQVDTDDRTKDFVVHLREGASEVSPLVLATPEWALMTIVRGEVNQLRADCAEWAERASS